MNRTAGTSPGDMIVWFEDRRDRLSVRIKKKTGQPGKRRRAQDAKEQIRD